MERPSLGGRSFRINTALTPIPPGYANGVNGTVNDRQPIFRCPCCYAYFDGTKTKCANNGFYVHGIRQRDIYPGFYSLLFVMKVAFASPKLDYIDSIRSPSATAGVKPVEAMHKCVRSLPTHRGDGMVFCRGASREQSMISVLGKVTSLSHPAMHTETPVR